MSEQLQGLIETYREARKQLHKALIEAFPIGAPVYVEGMQYFAKVAGVDGEFIRLWFEDGNIWPREPRSLTLCRWDDVPLYWRQRLIPDSQN